MLSRPTSKTRLSEIIGPEARNGNGRRLGRARSAFFGSSLAMLELFPGNDLAETRNSICGARAPWSWNICTCFEPKILSNIQIAGKVCWLLLRLHSINV